MPRSWRRLAVLVSLVAGCRAVLGVEEPLELNDETGCLRNSDCTGTDVCLFRVCGIPCTEDGDCSDGRRCLTTLQGAACVPHAAAVCDAEQCPDGLVCVAGACRASCTLDRHCLDDQRCVQGACRGTSAIHDPGASAATGGAGAASNTGGRAGSAAGGAGSAGESEPGGGAPPAQAGAGTEPQAGETSTETCEAGSERCAGKRLLRCDSEGSWAIAVNCPFVCNPDTAACDGECVPDTPRCNQNVPELCSDAGAWEAGEPCERVCSGGACTGACEPGALECSSLTVQECAADGTWSAGERCDYVCAEGACTGECVPGSTRCLADHRTLAQCGANGEWDDGSQCTYACVDDACGGTCVPGRQSCQGEVLFTCRDDGTPDAGTACEFVCRNNACTGECEPGVESCSENRPVVCDANGRLQVGAACGASQICRQGSCVANDPYAVGQSTRLSSASAATAGNVMYLTRVTVARRAALRRFGMHGEPGAQVRFALYTESNTLRPQTLIAQSEAVNIRSSTSAGATEANPASTLNLDPANYWVGAIYSANAPDYYQAVTGATTHFLDPQAFGGVLPATYPLSGATVPNNVMNYFIVVQDLPD